MQECYITSKCIVNIYSVLQKSCMLRIKNHSLIISLINDKNLYKKKLLFTHIESAKFNKIREKLDVCCVIQNIANIVHNKNIYSNKWNAINVKVL